MSSDQGFPGEEAWLIGLEDLIGAMGEDSFPERLIAFLAETCGAEHCSIMTYDDERPMEIASASLDGSDAARRTTRRYLDGQYWRSDPLVPRALSASSAILMRVDIADLDGELRSMIYETGYSEWLALVGGSAAMRIAIAISRHKNRGRFADDEMARLSKAAPILLAIVDKHAQMLFQRGDLSKALTSLEEIEACIRLSPAQLSARERDVCARILYGMSTAGIASELEISEQTVITYRKRAYQRLMIASQRELLLWYASCWNALHSATGGFVQNNRCKDRPRAYKAARRHETRPGQTNGLSPALRILLDLGQYPPLDDPSQDLLLSRWKGTFEAN